MKASKKLKTIAMSAALAGIMAVAPIGAHAEAADQPLHQGMNDPDVKPIQKLLKDFDYYTDKLDGIFGPYTFKAVSAFQGDYDIDEDGIFGPNTSDALDEVKSLQKVFKKAPELSQGDEGKKVKALQTQLQHLKYYEGKLDGLFGSKTQAATKKFQKTNDIAVDGIAGPDTYKALIHNPETAAEAKQKENPAKTADTSKAKKSSKKTGNSAKAKASQSTGKKAGKTITVSSTAYTANCNGCSGVTATGVNLKKHPNKKVIAVDPDVIPLGSIVQVPGYGKAIAADTGGAINGKKIDVFFPNKGKASSWGIKTVTVKVLN